MKQLSSQGLDFIKGWEKFSPTMYPDQGGLPTIGYGHLITNPKDPLMTASITEAIGREILGEDVRDPERIVNETVTVDLLQHEFDALVSLAFNIGIGAFAMSTLVRRLNQGNKKLAAAQFARWVYVQGERSTGLARRREAERVVFVEGRY